LPAAIAAGRRDRGATPAGRFAAAAGWHRSELAATPRAKDGFGLRFQESLDRGGERALPLTGWKRKAAPEDRAAGLDPELCSA
jgi:hypothetical protein